MSDILFRYLLMARRRDHSRLRRLFARDEPLLEAGVEQLVETAAARVAVRSQHERFSQRSEEVPASHRHRVRFYVVAQPDRPTPGSFEERVEEFPLQATLKVFTCSNCSGSGEVRCGRCSGRGRTKCWKCGGSGKVNDGNKTYICGTCSGSGTRTCPDCHGSGFQTCGRCEGEGELASWDVEVYRWLIEDRAGDEYPREDRRLKRAFGKWLEIDADVVGDLEPATVAEHLGFETPEATEVVARAADTLRRLEDEARQSKDAYLFHRSRRSLSPVGYAVVRLRGTARHYWLVGRGEKAREVAPTGRLDGRKLVGWLGFGSVAVDGWEIAVRGLEAVSGLVLDPWQILAGTPAIWLAESTVASLFLVALGVHRMLRREPPVPAVGLLPASGEPTPWLTCLAYLGSYTESLTVLDRAYDTQLERLLGKMRPRRQSESLTVELRSGRRIRLIEVARPARLSEGQLGLILQALDGVMILEEQDRSAADELEARLRTAAAGSDSDATPIHRVTVDRAPEAGDGDAVPIEAIRRRFVDGLHGDVDWNVELDRLWKPFDRLLVAASSGREP